MSETYISVETAIALAMQYCPDNDGVCSKSGHDLRELLDDLENAAPADVRPVPPGGIGEMSDGYHTFNGLYYQRMVLFAALVKQNKDSAWKSHRHEDGELCFGGGWFIVGIDTPDGSYTYHYEDKDWDLFDCEELPVGKHWDGHTEDDVTRLLSLPVVRPVKEGENITENNPVDEFVCSECGIIIEDWSRVEIDEADGERTNHEYVFRFCPNCGAAMTEEAMKILARRNGERRE